MPTQLSAKNLIAALYQTVENPDAIHKLCILCIGSKLTWAIRYNKSMTATTNKLEEVHTDLWGLYNLSLQSKSTYTAILMCKHISET